MFSSTGQPQGQDGDQKLQRQMPDDGGVSGIECSEMGHKDCPKPPIIDNLQNKLILLIDETY